MAERRKNKKKRETDVSNIQDEKPSKEEYAVAKYLKQNLPEKKTTLLGHKVEYFIASRALDCLEDSPWAKEHKKGELNFSNRDTAMDFMAKLLLHKFFHRAKKIVVQKDPKFKKIEYSTSEEKESKGKEKETKSKEKETKSKEKESKSKEKENKSKEKESKKSKGKSDAGDKDGKKETEVVEKKKEKKKIKLDMHLEQIFIDSNEPYVWIYDPIPLRTWITGTLMVVAAVLLCLFPLWPQTIRHYIYYLSVAAAFFLVFIIGLAVLRLVVFVILWLITFGKHHLWLLPNLTEDVGFFESFWPLYKYEYKGESKDEKEKKTKKSKSKDKDAEKEDDAKEDSKEESAGESEKKEQSQSEDSEQGGSDGDAQKTENGFEFLEAEEEESEGENRKTK